MESGHFVSGKLLAERHNVFPAERLLIIGVVGTLPDTFDKGAVSHVLKEERPPSGLQKPFHLLKTAGHADVMQNAKSVHYIKAGVSELGFVCAHLGSVNPLRHPVEGGPLLCDHDSHRRNVDGGYASSQQSKVH